MNKVRIEKSTQFRASRRLITLLLLLLMVLIVGSAVWDYYSVEKVTWKLAERQARGLIFQVEQAGETAAYAEQSVRVAVTDHLFAVAYLIRRLIHDEGEDNLDLNLLASEGGIGRIDLFDDHARWRRGNMVQHEKTDTTIQSFLQTGSREQILGAFQIDSLEEKYYGIAVGLPKGGAVRVAIDFIELVQVRQEIGLGSLLLDLSSHPEALYLLIDSPEGILAATPDLPTWIGTSNDPLHEKAIHTEEFKAEFTIVQKEEIFEARTPFGETEGVVLRLGIRTDELQKIRKRNRLNITIRTGILLALSLSLSAYLISHQNAKLLAAERDRMMLEVRHLEANRTLQERLAAMGTLAGGIAHEIRNPLNSVTIAAQRLEMEYQPTADISGYHQVVRALREEALRIGRIINDFLNYARPPATNKQRQNLTQTLAQVIDTFKAFAESRQVSFKTNFGDLPDFSFDADLIRQATLNLLKNAVDAVLPGQGKIYLSTGQESHWAVIQVTDNGPGVAEEDRGKIFNLYYTTRAEGTGVGLALVHRIAVEHDGRVEVSDTPGGGATFRLFLKL